VQHEVHVFRVGRASACSETSSHWLSCLRPGSVGVGTSAYVSAMALIWIGGMVFFGLGSLIDIAIDIKKSGEVIQTGAKP
jgi:hypothetical protein